MRAVRAPGPEGPGAAEGNPAPRRKQPTCMYGCMDVCTDDINYAYKTLSLCMYSMYVCMYVCFLCIYIFVLLYVCMYSMYVCVVFMYVYICLVLVVCMCCMYVYVCVMKYVLQVTVLHVY